MGFGTWRTANSGASWTQVDTNEVSGGSTQIYQPDYNGVLFMAGSGSGLGQGVLRSSDYGQTWAHVGLSNIATVVTGTRERMSIRCAAVQVRALPSHPTQAPVHGCRRERLPP